MVYFHSEKSELQLWNISKYWKNSGISDKDAIVIANKEAETKLKEHNNSEAANNFKYKFELKDYKKKLGLCIVNNEINWYLLYTYTFPYAKKNETHFVGHPAHFTVRINQKTGKTQFLYGE